MSEGIRPLREVGLDEIIGELLRREIAISDVCSDMLRAALYRYINVSIVSIRTGVTRPTIQKRMKKWGISIDDLREFKRRQLKL